MLQLKVVYELIFISKKIFTENIIIRNEIQKLIYLHKLLC